MSSFIEIVEGESIRLINLSHVREALYNPAHRRLSLHILGPGNEHLLTLEGPTAEAAYAQLSALAKDK
jgi:hypothetical protein